MAADLADELKTYLSNVADLGPLIGEGANARVYQNRLRQRKPLPALALEEDTGGTYVDLLVGDSGMAQAAQAIYSYADSRSEANGLSDVVRQHLLTYHGLMGQLWVEEVAAPQYRSTRQVVPLDGGEGHVFEVRQLYDIWHFITPAAPPAV